MKCSPCLLDAATVVSITQNNAEQTEPTIPLIAPKEFIFGIREAGYLTTASALSELIDSAIDARLISLTPSRVSASAVRGPAGLSLGPA